MGDAGLRTVGRYLWTNLSFLPLAPLLVSSVLIAVLERDRRRYYPVDEFPDLQPLVERYDIIRAEYDAAMAEEEAPPAVIDIDPGQLRLDPRGRWRGFVLRAFGRDVPENRARCPQTAATVDGIDGLYSAFFSVLQPGARLTPHRGQLKGILRVHLAIHVPKGCGIDVGGETRRWQEGELMMFDDTQRHYVWNHSDDQRVVLFMDYVRPVRRAWLRAFNGWALDTASRSRRVAAIADRA